MKKMNSSIGTNRVRWTILEEGRYKVYKDFKDLIV